jgi:hypothetical protein
MTIKKLQSNQGFREQNNVFQNSCYNLKHRPLLGNTAKSILADPSIYFEPVASQQTMSPSNRSTHIRRFQEPDEKVRKVCENPGRLKENTFVSLFFHN